MQILIPISGRSPFFPKEEFFFPKPMVEVGGRPMIEIVVEYLKKALPDAKFNFVVDKDDVTEFSLDRILQLCVDDSASIIVRQGPTQGALCSCLLAVDVLDPDTPLIIANSDQVIADDIDRLVAGFERDGADAGIITFNSSHPRWSYALADETGNIVQVAEKRVISRMAIAGFYYFARTRDFVESAQQAILNDAQTDGSFFISACLNEILLSGARIAHAAINARDYHSFYSPARIELFEHSSLAEHIREEEAVGTQINVVVPAGGLGSRFAKAGWKQPKPFLDVDGSMMLSRVLENVSPRSCSQTVLLQAEHLNARPQARKDLEQRGVQILPLDQLTEGTACTVLLARRHLDNDRPLLIANSDQLVDFDVDDFVDDCLRRKLHGSILVFRDPTMDLKWSFARTDKNGLVTEVAEKKPISDLATVGIYLFTRGSDFVRAAVDMIANNDRVNGEFYTCPVYNYMLRDKAQIGVYEVPQDAMHGLGTPEDLTAYLDSIGAQQSRDAPEA